MEAVISPINIEARRELGIKPGDTVRVWQKIPEKGKFRLQAFEGLVLSRKHGNEAGGTFCVRKSSQGIGVEKIFPLYSPMIDKIEIIKRSKSRRAKLYYIRDKVAKEIRRQMRGARLMNASTGSDLAEKEEVKKQAEAEAKAAEEAAAQKEAEAKAAEEAAQKAEQEAAEKQKEAENAEVVAAEKTSEAEAAQVAIEPTAEAEQETPTATDAEEEKKG